MPDMAYINKFAKEKHFSMSAVFEHPPSILEDLYYLFTKEYDEGIDFDVQNYLFPAKIIEDKILFRQMNPDEEAYYNYTLSFLRTIDYSEIIGFTPLDKTLRVLMYLVHLSESTNPQDHYDPGANPEMKNIEIPDVQALNDALKEQGENAEKGQGMNSQGGPQNVDNQGKLSKAMTSCVRDHLYDLNPSIAHIYSATKPADMPINKRILMDISVKAYLEEKVGMSTALDVTDKRNNQSTKRDRISMEDHGQITKINKTEMIKDTFDEKFVKKELVVREKVKPEEKKQILYMLLDDSGSMGNLLKQSYMRAVLLNRLESVAKGKSELYFANYVTNRYNMMEAKDLDGCKKMFQHLATRIPRGGGTHISHVLQETVKIIKEKQKASGGKYHDPEIMIVCDGDDHIDPETLDAQDVRINVVLLGTENPGLEKVAKNTGGFYTVEQFYNR